MTAPEKGHILAKDSFLRSDELPEISAKKTDGRFQPDPVRLHHRSEIFKNR
jgi:hypothetical protein